MGAYSVHLSRTMHVVGDQVCDTYTVTNPETGEQVKTFTIPYTPYIATYNKSLREQLSEFTEFTFIDPEEDV